MLNLTEQQIIDILRKFDVQYTTAGEKNVSFGFIGIRCRYCDDHSNHLGIAIGSGNYSCWRCKSKGSFIKLLMKLSGMTFDESKNFLEEYDSQLKGDTLDKINDIINGGQQTQSRPPVVFGGLPKYFEEVSRTTKYPLLDCYLERRKIHLDVLIQHKCGICRVGECANRLVIPIFFDGKLVSYQAADMTGAADLKYKTASSDVNQYVYNYDILESGGSIIITEGILDCWRVGPTACCTFGTHITKRQFGLILGKNPKEIIFCRDSDYYFSGLQYNSEIGQFAPFVENIKIVHFPDGHDPDSFGRDFGTIALQELICNAEHWRG